MSDNNIQMIKVSDLHPHPGNPRKDVGDVSELADSIKAQGIKQNLLVVENPDGDGYRVIWGHRRLAAARLAGLETVPCIIDSLDDKQQLELMIVENCQRRNLSAIEEADAYQGLLDLGDTAPKIAKKTGRSAKYVRLRLKMAAIPETVRSKSKDFAQLSVSDLEALAEFDDDPETQAELAETAGTDNWGYRLQRLRERRMERKWSAAARLAVENLKLEVSELEGKAYDNRKGYRYPDLICAKKSETFKYQWEGWLNLHGDPHPMLLVEHESTGVDKYWVYEHQDDSEEEKQKEEEKKRKAKEHIRLQPIKDLDSTSRELREEWLHTNLHTLTKPKITDAVTALALADLMGTSSYNYSRHGDINIDDLSVEAWNRIAGNILPHPKKDSKAGIWHLIEPDNWQAMRQEQEKNPQLGLLHLLCARAESLIDWEAWDDKDRRKDIIAPYYQTLETLGYPISDAETKALVGKYGKDEA
ncbi:ParB/RepB/Spo0J family partition protein [Bifidobacterium sp. ESL0728]|uniref:ParB/RepB/Spo0J family partition protein n=1 Tax=Bifidobacterium sp. ESL0728 TaxID=2983220 RepID=UPI0023F7B730|nr:ParB/RepB/Spo0J family partition protein [Bifidobacterium sp. ESL0728]WEV59703.1 ParB/RepB/Spo0J family partition protein [Bifidobacterium sp. ESL0728]